MFNVIETSDGTLEERKDAEKQTIESIQQAVGTNVNIVKFKRLGKQRSKPRPLTTEFNNLEDRMNVLKTARNLRNLPKEDVGAAVSIQPDLTKNNRK